jgi:hypothetical protein
MSAPEWTQSISNQSLCNFFYVFFVIYAVLTAITVVRWIGIFTTVKMSLGQAVALAFFGVMLPLFGTITVLFQYIICDRALKPS